MKKNMGSADRITRILLAIGFVILYYSGIISGTWGIVILVFAGLFMLTSIVSFCPIYTLFGLNTCPNKIKN